MRFHKVHGEDIALSEGGRVARRKKNQSAGLVFSDRPLKVEETVRLRFSEEPVLVVGVTRRDPHRFPARDLKETRHGGSWFKHLIGPSREFDLKLTLFGELVVNGEVFLTGLDHTRNLWALFELIGKDCRLESIEEPKVKRKWNHRKVKFEKMKVGKVSLECRRMAAVSDGQGYVFLEVKLEQVVVFEVMEARGESGIKVGFTSREPSAEEDTDYFYTAVSLAEGVKTGEIVSLYAGRTGEVRCNRGGGVPKTLFFVDPKKNALWLFLELQGRIAVRALVTKELYVRGEPLPPLWESTEWNASKDYVREVKEEVIPIDHPLPASPPPPIAREQITSRRNTQPSGSSQPLRSKESKNLPSTQSSGSSLKDSSSSKRRNTSTVEESSTTSNVRERESFSNDTEIVPYSSDGANSRILNVEERKPISNDTEIVPYLNDKEKRPILNDTDIVPFFNVRASNPTSNITSSSVINSGASTRTGNGSGIHLSNIGSGNSSFPSSGSVSSNVVNSRVINRTFIMNGSCNIVNNMGNGNGSISCIASSSSSNIINSGNGSISCISSGSSNIINSGNGSISCITNGYNSGNGSISCIINNYNSENSDSNTNIISNRSRNTFFMEQMNSFNQQMNSFNQQMNSFNQQMNSH